MTLVISKKQKMTALHLRGFYFDLNDLPGAILTRPEQLAPARKALEDRYHFVIQEESQKNCLNGEMFSRQYDKGKGIRIAAEAMGFDLSDTIGVGDSMNDIEMIETVGYSVCMGDGSPTLKAKSDYVCPPLEPDGLAAAFEKLGLV